MKILTQQKLLLFLFLSLAMSGCSSSAYFYQIYSTKSEQVKQQDDNFTYEDTQFKVTYDLWSEYGDIGFLIFNKTEKNIYLHLDKSFYVCNAIAYDYFQNRTFTETQTHSESKPASGWWWWGVPLKTQASSSSSSVSTPEPRIVCIPPKSAKKIYQFSIVTGVYRNCELLRYPYREKDIKTSNFDKNSSPYQFSNRIEYSFTENGEDASVLVHDFWVSSISNIPDSKFSKYTSSEFCNQKTYYYAPLHKASNNFYVRYANVGGDSY